MLVNKTIAGLYNGVSQQAALLRHESQVELQENAFSSLVDGCSKRPPTEHIAVLSSAAHDDVYVHTINRDANEKYAVIFTGDETEPLEIFNTLTGTKQTVRYGHLSDELEFTADDAVKAYVISSTPVDTFSCVTIADFTIITNKTVTAQMSGTPAPAGTPTVLMHVKQGVANTVYAVSIDGASVSYTTGNADAQNAYTYGTSYIALQLYTQLRAALSTSTHNISTWGSNIRISRVDGGPISMAVNDSWGDMALKGVNGKVQRFTDLPAKSFDGHTVAVSGSSEASASPVHGSYYVKYEASTLVWKETVKPGLDNKFNALTLPHKLVRTGVGQFTFAPINWKERVVGDEISQENPSFIGEKIKDVFFFKNRLGFLAGENVIFSAAGNYFNFWSKTVTDVLDDAPIDISSNTNEISNLYWSIPFQQNLIVFSEQRQFVVHSGENIMTSKTVAIDSTTKFETSVKCRPVACGSNVYFVTPSGNHSMIREYFVQPESLTNDAADITAHCPTYLPKNIIKATASSANDIMFFLSTEDRSKVYGYRYYWDADKKAQSAWWTNTFSGSVLNCDIIDNFLYLIIKYPNGVITLEKLQIDKGETGSLNFKVHLDRLVSVTGVYNAETKKTTWTLPYASTADNFSVVSSTTGLSLPSVEKTSTTTLEVEGDYSAAPCYIGTNYTQRVRLSEWFIKAPNSNVGVARGRLQIRTLKVAVKDTVYFKVEIIPKQRTKSTHVYPDMIAGISTLGAVNIVDRTESVLVMANAEGTIIDLVNDTYLPSTFVSLSYEGLHVLRSRIL